MVALGLITVVIVVALFDTASPKTAPPGGGQRAAGGAASAHPPAGSQEASIPSSASSDSTGTAFPPDSTPTTVSAIASETARAESWAAANLSHQATIVSDPAIASALRDAGFSAATPFSRSAHAPFPTLDYVVVSAGEPPSATERDVIDRSIPLAVFGAGPTRVTVDQVFPAGRAAADKALAHDAALRATGGTELIGNPGLVPDAAARAALRSGNLDLRAQNVCNVLVTGGRVWLSVNAESPAEKRAHLPIRSITVTAQNPSAMQVTLAALTPPFRPSITTIAPGKVRLTWPPQIAPVQIVGN
jgi:hypothetical protein